MKSIKLSAFIVLLAIMSCQTAEVPETPLACAEDNAGLVLPDGFCAIVVADSLGRARQLAIREDGDIFVVLRTPTDQGTIAALRDTTGNGIADIVTYFGEVSGGGIGLREEHLYVAADSMIVRYPLPAGELLPNGDPETVVSRLHNERSHAIKTFTFDHQNGMYVNVGAPSNTCQNPIRSVEVPGQDPCPELEDSGGIWRFHADTTNQTQQDDGHRYATGIRNAVAIRWNVTTDKLYAVQHGRDDLHRFWPQLYTTEENNALPAEELFAIEEADDFGWPYCYYDHIQGEKLLNPEYGGDGTTVGRCAEAKNPIYGFPGHWAPNDMVFYTGSQFPEKYADGTFIAFHGSWNRAPVQKGFNVTFLPLDGDMPAGNHEIFADGFAAADSLITVGMAQARPTGLALGPDGSLYIADSIHGRIWRIVYTG